MKLNKLSVFAAGLAMALLLSACGGSSSSGQPASQPVVSQPAVSQSQPAGSQPDADRQGDGEYTYESESKDAKFKIDFVKYPDRSSGEGKVENIDDAPMALGAASCNFRSESRYGTNMEACKDVNAVPEQIKNNVASLFNETKYGSAELKIATDIQLVINATENIGVVNGYELVRFTATWSGNVGQSGYQEFPVVGYCTLLNQSGYPVYAAAIDVSEDQAYADQLDGLAYNCITSLRETA